MPSRTIADRWSRGIESRPMAATGDGESDAGNNLRELTSDDGAGSDRSTRRQQRLCALPSGRMPSFHRFDIGYVREIHSCTAQGKLRATTNSQYRPTLRQAAAGCDHTNSHRCRFRPAPPFW